jgi:hypothetical protein
MRLDHEGVKVDPPLGFDIDVIEGEIHEHRLAAADAAPQIDSVATRFPPSQEPVQQPLARGQRKSKAIEGEDPAKLCRVGP